MRCERRALTLIEVMAGLFILSVLLVAVLAAQRSHAKQIAAAETKLNAVELADQLLQEWFYAKNQVPIASGNVDSFRWSTKVVRESGPFGTSIVQLRIENMIDIDNQKAPILAVDLFVPPIDSEMEAED